MMKTSHKGKNSGSVPKRKPGNLHKSMGSKAVGNNNFGGSAMPGTGAMPPSGISGTMAGC